MTDFWTSYALYVLRWVVLALPGSWLLMYVQRRVRSTTAAMIVSQAVLGVAVFWLDRWILK